MEKLVAAFLSVGALGYVWRARGFEAGFIADPIGPSAFPVAIGALLLATSVTLWTKKPSGELPPVSWRHVALVAGLFVYVAVLDRLGFVVTTTMLASGVVALFSGPIRRGVVLSFLLSLSIFVLFTYVLSIPLPRGF